LIISKNFSNIGLLNKYSMALPKQIHVKEDLNTLKVYAKSGNDLIKKRMRLLIELKKNSSEAQSKLTLSKKLGINHNSIVKWRNIYLAQGIEALLKDGRKGGYRPSVVSEEEHAKIKGILNDKHNGIVGYTELLNWVKKELKKDMKYITLVKYVERHFGAKIKVARKSNINKDLEKVAAFKKTSRKSARS
jgi:transposase